MIKRIFGGKDKVDSTCSVFSSESRAVSRATLSFVTVSLSEGVLESGWSGRKLLSSGVGGRESGRGMR